MNSEDTDKLKRYLIDLSKFLGQHQNNKQIMGNANPESIFMLILKIVKELKPASKKSPIKKTNSSPQKPASKKSPIKKINKKSRLLCK